MRRKSRKAKSWKEPTIFAQFRIAFPRDALERHLCGDEWEKMKRLERCGGYEVHHIWHNGKRCDLWGNLLPTSSRAHHYCHKHPVIGSIAAMYARLELGGEQEELLADWQAASGYQVLGWVQAMRDAGRVPECYLDLVQNFLERF